MKHKTFRLSTRTRQQLTELAGIYGESQTAVIRRLISERHAQEMVIMKQQVHIIEHEYDTELIMGDYDEKDEEGALNAYEAYIDRVLSEAYPTAEIQVAEGHGSNLKVCDGNGDPMHESREEVQATIEAAWNTFEWYPDAS